MIRRPLAVLSVAVALALGSSGWERPAAQEPAPQPRASYQSQVTAVLVDVVVRDKKGRPVTDLTADEFEIREDGVKQQVGSFTLVNRGTGLGISVRQRRSSGTTAVEPTAPAGESPTPDAPAAMTALVFDDLSSEALIFAQRAALGYVPAGADSSARVAVFAADPSIRTLQPYTEDLDLVRGAIRRVAASGSSQKESVDARMDALRERRSGADARARANPATTSAAGTAGLGAAGSEIGQLEVERRLVEGEIRMLQSFDTLDRDHRGYGTTTALMAVLNTLAYAPGRKTVVFFSQGLPASPAMQAHLQSIIEAANRSNITIYTVDAAGLRARSTTTEAQKEMAALVEDRLRQTEGAPEPAFEPLMRNMERAEDVLRLDPQGGLALLAEDTGGFLVRDTNNLQGGLRRIDEDSRFHYLLTYAPSNDTFDGRFRSIDVKVTRPGTAVYARKGYRAVARPDTSGAYEAPALALLDGGGLPNAFPVWARGFVFPDPKRPGLVPLVVKVDTSALVFDVDAARNTYSAEASIIVRLKDAKGWVVQKLSQQYVLFGDAKDVEAAKRGKILFYREPDLAPGLYQMETVVYDGHARRGSARVSTLTVPAPAARLQVSSVLVVSKTEKVQVTASAQSAPLYFGDVLLYPNLGEPMARQQDSELMFYFVAYPAAARPSCEATVQLVRNGQPLAEAPLPLDPSPADGRLRYVGRLPVAHLAAGTYELRVNVSDGRERETRSTFFTLG
jgi:VWFA-related protein